MQINPVLKLVQLYNAPMLIIQMQIQGLVYAECFIIKKKKKNDRVKDMTKLSDYKRVVSLPYYNQTIYRKINNNFKKA